MRNREKLLALAMVVGISATMAGCTAAAPELENGVSSSEAPEASSDNDSAASKPGQGIIRATEMTSCEVGPGPVAAQGVVVLPEGSEGTVRVTVSWVDATNSSVYASGIELLNDVRAGEEAGWTVTAELGTNVTNVKCVLGATLLDAD